MRKGKKANFAAIVKIRKLFERASKNQTPKNGLTYPRTDWLLLKRKGIDEHARLRKEASLGSTQE